MSRVRTFVLFALAALLAGCASIEQAPRDPLDAGEWRSTKARMYHDLALQCLRAEDHDRARRLLQQAVQFDAKDGKALELLARLAFVQGDHDAAAGAATMLLAIDATSTSALCTLGAVAEARNQPREAEECYRRAIAARPGEPRPVVDLHRLLLAQQRLDEATALRAELQRRFPQTVEATLDHATDLAASGSWAAAASAYGTALVGRPEDPAASFGYALGSVLSARPGDALALAARMPPHARGEDPSLVRALVVAQLQAGDRRGALREIDLALAQGRPSAPLRLLRGELLAQTGALDAAQAEFEQSLAAAPGTARAHAGLGRVHLARGLTHAAARSFEQALALQPANAVNEALLAAALVRSGDAARAAPHARRARADAAAAPLIAELTRQHPELARALVEAR